MVADVTLAQAAGLPLEGWKVEEGGLVLRFAGPEGERRLRCACGRCHWIVETRRGVPGDVLAVKCHGCGTRAEILLAAFRVTPR